VVTIAFVFSEHLGWWDRYLGLTDVLEAAARFETSYSDGVKRVVVPGDSAWPPVLDRIRRYSPAQLPSGREPRVLARFIAVASAKIDAGPGNIAEWTAPSTPIALLYRDWPGNTIPPSDYRVVGTIGDLRAWVDKRRADLHFLGRDILISFTSVMVGLMIWLLEHASRGQQAAG
jgi:hypothetical protein